MAKSIRGVGVTKKHLARQEREQLQTRYIAIGSIIVLVIVLGLLGYGVLNEYVLKPMKPVAEVAGDKITTSEFQASVRYQRYQLINQYSYYQQIFGDDSSFRSQFEQQLAYPQIMGQQVIDSLVDDRVIRIEAQKRGISVTKEEVDDAIQEDFGFYPNGTPVPTATVPPAPTSTYSALQQTVTAPTATATPTMTLVITATATAIPATPTLAPTATIDPSLPTATPNPTATPFTKDAFNQKYNQYSSDLKTNLNISDADLRRMYESRLLREKLLDAVMVELDITTPEEEQVWARHILVSGEVTATQILQDLKNGADFAKLAAEYSTDTSNKDSGGVLDWFGKGSMAPEFEQAAWSLPVGEVVSAPVKTTYGYHIIQVLGHEIRPLQATDYNNYRQQRFTTWLKERRTELETAGKITIDPTWVDITPSDPALPASQTQQQPVAP